MIGPLPGCYGKAHFSQARAYKRWKSEGIFWCCNAKLRESLWLLEIRESKYLELPCFNIVVSFYPIFCQFRFYNQYFQLEMKRWFWDSMRDTGMIPLFLISQTPPHLQLWFFVYIMKDGKVGIVCLLYLSWAKNTALLFNFWINGLDIF